MITIAKTAVQIVDLSKVPPTHYPSYTTKLFTRLKEHNKTLQHCLSDHGECP
jgi:hypothetical protein